MRTCRQMTAIVGLLFAAADVHAQQKYPSKPIRLIVPYATGGGADIFARSLSQKLTESFAAPVVLDNRTGAGGTIGTEIAVRADPDGHTMVLVSAGYAANAALYKLPYDAMNDVAPIALIGETGLVVTIHPSVRINNIRELIAYDKASPGKLSDGSSDNGGTTHLATELFNQMAGTKMAHVPYKGTGAALNDLLGIAVTTAKRSNAVPDIPTVDETVPGYEAVQWFAILGPKALSKNIVSRWNREINRILQLPDVKECMAGEGLEPAGGTPDRFREVLERDIAKWQNVVKVAGIQTGH